MDFAQDLTIARGGIHGSIDCSSLPDILKALAEDYEIPDKEGVAQFLERYPSVAPMLSEARSVIRRYFGDALVRLELFYDPEIDDEQPDLFVYIETPLNAQATRERLDRLDDQWWLKRKAELAAPVVVSVRII